MNNSVIDDNGHLKHYCSQTLLKETMMKMNPGKKLVVVDASGKVVAEINPKNILKRDGKPVFGPNVRQTLTIGEMVSRGLAPSRNKASEMKANGDPASVELLAA